MNVARKKGEVENIIFRWLLIVSIPFWLHRILRDFMIDSSSNNMASDFFFLLASCLILFLTRYKSINTQLKLTYCVGWLVGFVYYWHLLGGLTGPMTYIFFSAMTVFLGFIPGRFKEAFAIILCSIAIALALDHKSEVLFSVIPLSEDIKELLPIDYVVNSAIIALAAILLKNAFDRERGHLENQNLEMEKINDQLNQQNTQLAQKSRDIEAIKNNLEALIHERTIELESKHKLLEQYAYDNSHLVRKPLTNLQGLLNVFEIERELHSISNDKIDNLRKKLGSLDEITKKINLTIN
ncbi:MAG: hypothetical protein ABJH72_20680 [Reichenbachiella sp.]|uniref:hypothetical protein n=1 Tax=Reichenbachiella sp. TaxID=2184521 RepID=UPI0032968957